MSNKTQLQTNNTALDGYIARINAAKDVAASLPEAGSGGSGGGSVETCTVTVTAMMNPLTKIAAMRYVDGVFEQVSGLIMMVGSTIDNVVCGSLVTVICTSTEPSVSNATPILTTDWINDEGMLVYAYVFNVNYA